MQVDKGAEMPTSDTFNRGIGNYRGTRDYFGDEARWRARIIATISQVFESFGFEPLETPGIETERTLTGKYGEEGETKRFKLGLPFPNEGGLRYDHTVPLARFMAMNWNRFPLPYRRYAIGPVWRNETTQAGRFRQFFQCDFDTVGSISPVIDAEIVAMNYTVLTRLGFKGNFIVKVNDRRLLNSLANALGFINPDETMALFRAWDKQEKFTLDQIRSEFAYDLAKINLRRRREEGEDKEFDHAVSLARKRLSVAFEPATALLSEVPDDTAKGLRAISKYFAKSPDVLNALGELGRLLDYIAAMGVPTKYYQFWPLLARGLDYYTGPIFETIVESSGIGSITGGGRFDNLIAQMGGPDMAASGSSFGLERVMEVMEQLSLKPKSTQPTQVFITLFDLNDPKLCQASFELAGRLRLAGLNVEVYTGEGQKLAKQLDIANRKCIPLVTILGTNELNDKMVTIKDLRRQKTGKGMSTSNQILVPLSKAVEQVHALLQTSWEGA